MLYECDLCYLVQDFIVFQNYSGGGLDPLAPTPLVSATD
jgi:hypothetical protein